MTNVAGDIDPTTAFGGPPWFKVASPGFDRTVRLLCADAQRRGSNCPPDSLTTGLFDPGPPYFLRSLWDVVSAFGSAYSLFSVRRILSVSDANTVGWMKFGFWGVVAVFVVLGA